MCSIGVSFSIELNSYDFPWHLLLQPCSACPCMWVVQSCHCLQSSLQFATCFNCRAVRRLHRPRWTSGTWTSTISRLRFRSNSSAKTQSFSDVSTKAAWMAPKTIYIYIVWKQNVARRLLNLLPSVVTLLVQIVSSCRFLNREIYGNLWKSTITVSKSVSISFLLWGVCPRRGWWADVSRLQGPQIEALRHCVSLCTFADNRTLQDGTFQHRG